MATPGKPRQSAIPTPGRASHIPTPGRPRSSSGIYQTSGPSNDEQEMTRAFADALRANDPAQHRVGSLSTSSSLSPKSASLAVSGRRSVAGRPASAASTSSALSASTRTSAKTPARPPSRPPSRHSDLYTKNRTFDIGDNVRIESLGFEGVLRFLGEIEGKPGQWAGVELGGGFAGKGKNDGSVGGKRYFSCANKCGVFVAVTKLSAPAVRHGAVHQRPPSVASTRNGRVTPAMSGRITPSFSTSFSRTPSASFANGRITPANSGRITPSLSTSRIASATTPSLKPRSTSGTKPASIQDKITIGSRASKYANMTAKDLNNSRSTHTGPSPLPASPQTSRIGLSPSRSTGSPFSTPRAMTASKLNTAFAKGRPSGNTPRARVPSPVSMPPPASPFSKSSHNGYENDLGEPESISRFNLFGDSRADSRPASSASVRSTSADELSLLTRLQSRLDALEYENDRLRTSSATNHGAFEISPTDTSREKELDELRGKNIDALAQVTRLEEELKEAQTLTSAQQEELASLSGIADTLREDLDKTKQQDKEAIDELSSQMDAVTDELQQLQKSLSDKETAQSELEEHIRTKDVDIAALQSRLTSVTSELEEERKELGVQIDELRIAGQETIALYEERLSAVEEQRYDLECRLSALLEKAGSQEETAPARVSETAAEIDNETLRDQVHHLQKKISTMEDIIEDHRANAEKEDAAFQERMKRLKEKEDGMRKELNEGKKEVERVLAAEANARNRIEEIEEALRESTMALENARAEVEALRSELANVDGLIEGNADVDLPTRITEFTRRMGHEREQKEKEINNLKTQLQLAHQQPANAGHGLADLQSEIEQLTEQLTRARQEVEERDRDLRELKKKLRDVPVMNGSLDTTRVVSPTSSKNDMLSGGKEEITGLKHIVQELQKENSTAMNKVRMLESENELLRSETEQLRQEVRILEDNLDTTLQNEEAGGSGMSLGDDTSLLQKRTKEQALEIEQLRKKLSEMEVKHGRAIHDLNKEIGELEALVESKIYREDELEQEIERLKDKISRAKKSSSKSSTEPSNRLSSATSSDGTPSEVPVCEICGPGHDIFNCDLLKEDRTETVCEDCSMPGHTASECPHSLEVF